LTHMLNALLDGRELIDPNMIQAFFLHALIWSLGAALLEDGRAKFDQYLKRIATMRIVEPAVALAELC